MDMLAPAVLMRTTVDVGVLALAAAVAGWLLSRWSTVRAMRAEAAAVGLLAAATVAAVTHAARLLGIGSRDAMLLGQLLVLALLVASLALLFRRLVRVTRALGAARSARERFLKQISHELRTPLNSIIGFSQLSRSLLEQGRTDAAVFSSYQADIERSADGLGRLIDDFADLAALETGRLQLSLEPVDLAEKVRCCEGLLREGAEAKGLVFRVEGSCVPRLVRADPNRVRQVLVNVMHNAILYTERGQVTVYFVERPTSWCVAVHDTGTGMAAPELARLLEPLEHGAESPNVAAAGPGLGLPLVQQLMRAMRGRLEIESAPGRGTTVRLAWPKAFSPERSPAAPVGSRGAVSRLA